MAHLKAFWSFYPLACHFYFPGKNVKLFSVGPGLGELSALLCGALGWHNRKVSREYVHFPFVTSRLSLPQLVSLRPKPTESLLTLVGELSKTKNMQHMGCFGLDCVPQISHIQILVPSASECGLIWVKGLYRRSSEENIIGVAADPICP